jgi:hypothetical protein
MYHRALACLQATGLHRGAGGSDATPLLSKASMTDKMVYSVRPLVRRVAFRKRQQWPFSEAECGEHTAEKMEI